MGQCAGLTDFEFAVARGTAIASAVSREILQNGATPYAMLYHDESGATSPEWRRFQRQFAGPAIAQTILRGKSKLRLKRAAE